ncbi:MAG: beta/gamma crystallin-related protein [Casimicrobiaceae bacterium]
MNIFTKSALGAALAAIALQASADITFFENDGFSGRSFTTGQPVNNLQRFGFNDRASSAVVKGGRWEVCQDKGFGGPCVVLRPGSYGSLSAMGLNDRISSVRAVGSGANARNAYADPGLQSSSGYDYRRGHDERLFEADVTSVRAVVGPPEQRCWVERQDVVTNSPGGDPNVPGAIVGAVVGGILGHQIGGGRGQDIATAGGAVGGAVVGANVGRSGGQQVVSQDVQRCQTVASNSRPDYWDVTYQFRGSEHRVQMTAPPGPRITVNAQGEPRV